MNPGNTDPMHYTDDELVLHHYGESGAPRAGRAAEHLSRCTTCAAAYSRLQHVLAAVDGSPVPEPPDGFERIAWARLHPVLRTTRGRWLSSLGLSPARLAWIGAVVVLVTGAFLAGRLSHPAPSRPGAEPASALMRERLLLSDLGEHLDRSQAMLIELISTDAGGVPAERERAEELLSDNRLYRQTAAVSGNSSLVTVLDELERVLIDIAAGPDVVSPTDMENVRRQIESDGLLFKVRVLAKEVRDRQNAAIRRTSRSS